MSKLLKLISVSLLGLFLTSNAFAATEVVYIPKNTGNPYFDSIIKGFEVGAENMVIIFQQLPLQLRMLLLSFHLLKPKFSVELM